MFLVEEIKQWRVLIITATMVGFQEERFFVREEEK